MPPFRGIIEQFFILCDVRKILVSTMSAVVDGLLAEFEGKYARLVWPDKNIILDLTAFCERNIAISLHLSDIIIARIIDPATDVTHKLPIFYLIDAVMKHVGGPYPALFSRHLAEVFKRAFDEVPFHKIFRCCENILFFSMLFPLLTLNHYSDAAAYKRKGAIRLPPCHLGGAKNVRTRIISKNESYRHSKESSIGCGRDGPCHSRCSDKRSSEYSFVIRFFIRWSCRSILISNTTTY